MTEDKKFKIVDKGIFGKQIAEDDEIIGAGRICDLLNENEQLKQSNKLLSDFREFITEDMQKTKNENEQLEIQIKIFEEFLKGNNLEIDWNEFCTLDEECSLEIPCQYCRYIQY